MKSAVPSPSRTLARCAIGAAAAGGALYLGHAAAAWIRYGHVKPGEGDPLLDAALPDYEVAERHHIRVAAPAEVVFAAGCDLNFEDSRIVRLLFRARELALGGTRKPLESKTLLAMLKASGWAVLAEIPGREIVLGTVTRPWEANVRFHALPPEQFQAFHEPGWAKIVSMIGAEPVGARESIAKTETRATATDATAREKFRLYWSLLSPGILLIRRIALRMVKKDAERHDRRCG